MAEMLRHHEVSMLRLRPEVDWDNPTFEQALGQVELFDLRINLLIEDGGYKIKLTTRFGKEVLLDLFNESEPAACP